MLDSEGNPGEDTSDPRARAGVLLCLAGHGGDDLTTRGPDWWTDGYFHGPGSKALLTLFDAEHSLGGIVGVEVRETTDESAERAALGRVEQKQAPR